jgi:hypothetical protein
MADMSNINSAKSATKKKVVTKKKSATKDKN